MAAPAAASQQPVSAQVVGNAFVQQYYHILHQSPGLVHKFYQDISKLGRPEEDGSMSITTTMDAINSKIISINYDELRAESKSVDAQESLSGGVNVLVTGFSTGKDNAVKKFTQSFFLAPQDKGYFVLNDMFRYMEDVNHNDGNSEPVDDSINPEQGTCGRFPIGRGAGGFRNEGLRGRGNYGGGRGYNRGGEFGGGRNDYGGNRGGGRGGDGYPRERVNRGTVVNGTAKNMAPRVPATA